MAKETYEQEYARQNKYFEMVQPADNWKNPIDKIIDTPGDDVEDKISDAVIFFTGSVPRFTALPNGKTRVTAEGYYLTIGS